MSQSDKKLLVLGSSGLLGSRFLSGGYAKEWKIISHLNVGKRFDLCSKDETYAMLRLVNPDVILNFVGLTDVDQCELSPKDAYRGNVKTVENIANWIKSSDKSIRLIHISTDQLYDGGGPHQEDNVSPSNYYAFSKYAGELIGGLVEATILRTNFVGRSESNTRGSLTDWLFSSLVQKNYISVFQDVMFSPLSMSTLCGMIEHVINQPLVGTYNLGSKVGCSKADFAYEFAHCLNLETKFMNKVSTEDVDFIKTYRPKDMRMDVTRFETKTGLILPDLSEEIRKVAEEYKDGKFGS